ncbi:MAG: serine hydrolase [Balneolaceae bacterium]|nr:serine hydrolase [Balneolaceae bacterium]MCH8548142.1 serine hydrolase [Balneolaceae bacterium]
MKFSSLLWLLPLFILIGCSPREAEDPSLEKLDELVEEALRDDQFTGAVLYVGVYDSLIHKKAYGFADLYDENLRVVERQDSMTTGHIFDLASLTKIFTTTYGLMALYSDGLIDPEDPIGEYLEEFSEEKHQAITIAKLLNHTSGLAQWFPTYYIAENSRERRAWSADQPLIGVPGDQRRYSDLGFMLLGDLIEEVSGKELNQYLYERIYSPLGLNDTQFNVGQRVADNVVSTSHGNPFERKMVYDPDFGYEIDIDPDIWQEWREYTLNGEVNDGNAFYTHGGVAGHAGLFSTADDLLKLLMALFEDGTPGGVEIFTPEAIARFTTEDEHGNGLGWAMEPSALHAVELPAGSLGHTGFTGTNFVIDPESGRWYILLTNRQHVGVDSEGNYPNLRPLRERISGLVFYNSLSS